MVAIRTAKDDMLAKLTAGSIFVSIFEPYTNWAVIPRFKKESERVCA